MELALNAGIALVLEARANFPNSVRVADAIVTSCRILVWLNERTSVNRRNSRRDQREVEGNEEGIDG
jgi:hypothetical protein